MRNRSIALLIAALASATCAGAQTLPDPAAPEVLYSQLSSQYDYTYPVLSQISTNGGNSLAADDFTVDEDDGWTVTGFTFAVSEWLSQFGSTNITYNLYVYADAGGVPDDAGGPLCVAEDTQGALDGTLPFANLTVALPIPCLLPRGTYWVALQGDIHMDASLPGAASFALDTYTASPTPGSLPVWKTAAGTNGCSAWSPISQCGWSETALGFEVLGTPGGGNDNGLEFKVTVAPDNGDPNQCGTATTLEATVGDRLNFCYTVTNRSGRPFAYHTLVDSLGGTLFSMLPYDLEDGQSYQFNRIVTAEQAENGYVTAAWTANDPRLPGYDADTSGPSQFVDISATGTALGDIGNDGSRVVTVPFPITYYGVTTSTIGVSNNGAIIVGATRPVTAVNTALPNTNAVLSQPALFPLWDDFDATAGGTYYATVGTAPNRKFVVEWYHRPHYPGAQNGADTATFEVVFDEASGTFSYEYADVEYTANGNVNDPSTVCNGGACATIGVQQDATYYTQYSFNTNVVADGTSIVWRSRVTTPVTSQAAVRLIIGAPVLSVGPGALTGSAQQGTTTTVLLTVGNAGNRDLTWSIDSAEADAADPRAHFPALPYVAPTTPALTNTQSALGAAASASSAASVYGPLPDASAAPLAPLAAANVPAFAFGGYGPDGGIHPAYLGYFMLDAADPSWLQGLVAMPIQTLVGGAFIDNDFSTEYVVGQGSGLYAFDTATGGSSYLGSFSVSGRLTTGLAWDATTRTLYASMRALDTTTSYLYQLDYATGAATEIAEVDGVVLAGIAFDATGHLYGVDVAADQLVAIDKRNGDWAGIGPLGFEIGGTPSIAFDPRTGVLWMAAHPIYNPVANPVPAIYTLDTASGQANMVALVVQSVDLTALALAVPYAGCSDPSTIPWLSATPDDGTLAPGASTRVTATFDATNLAPGTYTAQLCVLSNDLSKRVVGVPVSFTVTPAPNQVPSAADDAYSVRAGATLTVAAPGVLANDADTDGDALVATLVAGPAHGTLALNPDGSFIYVAAAGFAGTDTFTYVANDGHADSAPATVTITVQAASNRPPVAQSDAYTATAGSALTIAAPGVLANDTDADGDALVASLATGPSHGTLALGPDGGFIYVAADGFTGTDTFTYVANDGQADSAPATVTITVQPRSSGDAIFANGFDATAP